MIFSSCGLGTEITQADLVAFKMVSWTLCFCGSLKVFFVFNWCKLIMFVFTLFKINLINYGEMIFEFSGLKYQHPTHVS